MVTRSTHSEIREALSELPHVCFEWVVWVPGRHLWWHRSLIVLDRQSSEQPLLIGHICRELVCHLKVGEKDAGAGYWHSHGSEGLGVPLDDAVRFA